MKIDTISKQESYIVWMSDGACYTRHSAGTWQVQIGETDEPVNDPTELETIFQEYLANQKTP